MSHRDTPRPTTPPPAENGECAWVEARLDDHVDDLLNAEEQSRVEGHLATCATCREQHRGLERLLAAAARLPSVIEPEHDLWPALAKRLDKRSDEPPATRRNDLWQAPWWQQIAAALIFTLLGGGLAGGFDRLLPPAAGPDSDPDGAPIALTTSADEAGGFRRASSSNGTFVSAEAEYLRAKESLWLAVYDHRDELSPLQLKLVERNLEVIDDAIRELRLALEDDPENPQLQRLVLASHRRGLDLLWGLVKSERT